MDQSVSRVLQLNRFHSFAVGLTRILFILPVVLLLGCGSSAGKAEKLVPVTGTVMLDGKPTQGIRLIFQPIKETKAVGGCSAETDEQGKYEVTHWSKKKGLPPGKYEILFTRRIKADGTVLGPSESPTVVQSMDSISKMYSDPSKAGVHNRIEIPETGIPDLDFKISSQTVKKK